MVGWELDDVHVSHYAPVGDVLEGLSLLPTPTVESSTSPPGIAGGPNRIPRRSVHPPTIYFATNSCRRRHRREKVGRSCLVTLVSMMSWNAVASHRPRICEEAF